MTNCSCDFIKPPVPVAGGNASHLPNSWAGVQLDIFSSLQMLSVPAAPPASMRRSWSPDISEREARSAVLAEIETVYADDLAKSRTAGRRYCYQNHGLVKYGIPWTVTADDVREARQIEVDISGDRKNNKNGGIFKDPKSFAFTGHWYESKIKGSHSNRLRIWTLSREKFIEKFGRVPSSAVFAESQGPE